MDQIYKTDLNELFSYQRKGEKLEEKEKVIEIEIERLRDFKEHPFHVKDDKEMSLLKESIKNYGILSPLIVRPVLDGVYEIVSGHRRKYAAQQLGYYKLPVIIRVMNDDETEFTEDTAILTAESNEIGVFGFENVPFGNWIIRELKAAPAFVLNETTYPVTISENEEIVEIEIENRFIVGSVQTTKVDAQQK